MEAEAQRPPEANVAARHAYETPWPAYALAWSQRQDPRFRLALGSCLENEANKIRVVDLNEDTKAFDFVAEAEHAFPPTKLMWKPDDSSGSKADLLASSSTALNIWKVEDSQVKLVAKLANTRAPVQAGTSTGGHLPPLTSFDWSSVCHHKIGVSSVDTTCTIWNLEKQKIETQLIAHDKAVYDIAFSQADSLFASVGADGSVRLFDQRNLDHSTIIYEASPPSPLLRLAWNKINTNHIATIAMDVIGVILIDIRRPSVALASLYHQDACVNHIAWAPHSRSHLLCGTEDGYGLIWDVKDAQAKSASASTASTSLRVEDGTPKTEAAPEAASARPRPAAPLLAYHSGREVYQVQWPASQPDHVALGGAGKVEILQV
mmetsp:Transcript_57835/g.130379  ORF Transcript_57835/g.130379 Transcript_57835/m.130379 type:complete len:376 (+) Transcript_57835:181-1308(+)